MPCFNCSKCTSDDECFPKDFKSLEKWRKNFANLRKQWSDYTLCGKEMNSGGCHCCCKTSSTKLVKGRFGLAWVSETPKKKCCTPCGWQLEICDTPSQVEYQCDKMEQWANFPPVDGCRVCSNNCCVRKRCCSLKPTCHGIKVKPFQLTSQEDCCCSNCKGGCSDKAVGTDDCNCSESKANLQVDKSSGNQDVKDTLVPVENAVGNSAPAPSPRSRSRGRRGRR